MKNIRKFYPPWIELIPLLIVALLWVYVASSAGSLPDLLPSHFGLNGMPDRWAAKNFFSVYGYCIVTSFLCLLIQCLNIFLLINAKDPRRVLNLSKKSVKEISTEQVEALRHFSVRNAYVFNLILVCGLAFMTFNRVRVCLGYADGLSLFNYIFLLLLFIASVYFILKSRVITEFGALPSSRPKKNPNPYEKKRR